MASVDKLSVLPVDVLFNIFSIFLLYEYVDDWDKDSHPNSFALHPYAMIALLSRHLRDQIEAYCTHELKVLRNKASCYRDRSSGKGRGPRRFALLKWLACRCVFCGVQSWRTSDFMSSGLSCCEQCDDTQWPEKIIRKLFHAILR